MTGFDLLKQKIRKKSHKGPKIAGGLSVCIKPGVSHMVKAVPNDNNDCIWVKIKKEVSGVGQDVYLATVNISPEKTNNDKNELLLEIYEEAINFKEKGIVLMQGDFNAHTGNMADYIIPDKSDEMFGIEICEQPLLRNSEDRKPLNKRGSCLLDLCKSHDFLIVNGRKAGDIFWKIYIFPMEWMLRGRLPSSNVSRLR